MSRTKQDSERERLDRLAEDRFWKYVRIGDECWEWAGPYFLNGYPRFHHRGINGPASRYAYALFREPIPAGMLACHHCDNPRCVRFDHIFIGTVADNMADAKRKGRLAAGERNSSRAKPERLARGERNGNRTHPHNHSGEKSGSNVLTDQQVMEIRCLYASGNFLQSELGRRYAVDQTTISGIVLGKRWKHLPTAADLAYEEQRCEACGAARKGCKC